MPIMLRFFVKFGCKKQHSDIAIVDMF